MATGRAPGREDASGDRTQGTTRLVGLSYREGEPLLRMLIDHVRDPAFQCRFQWEVDSLAFWDNRSVQHYAVPDYTDRRVMNRVTWVGDRPR
jgi:taurine dioxygenase